ncbi:DUF3043 domain-containing protein [Apilactobacillus zhangqiuensis]|uniref:DUF3043 domain-containing protein n=1 Tax=Apilactobacillus zhangqiuensis TaxID=2841031 RepID=UPI001C7E11C3|nr:DUF3043 domain-containing protein [Apilactobacillus zhangqiuensis]
MKESLFIKLVKYFYGISKPFDEFARDVINDARNKIAFWLMIYIVVSAYALMLLTNWYNHMNVINGVIFADLIVFMIANAYMGRVISKNKLERYEFDSEEERKFYGKRFIISRFFTWKIEVAILFYPISVWLRHMGMSESILPSFIGCFIGALVAIYMQYCNCFKK